MQNNLHIKNSRARNIILARLSMSFYGCFQQSRKAKPNATEQNGVRFFGRWLSRGTMLTYAPEKAISREIFNRGKPIQKKHFIAKKATANFQEVYWEQFRTNMLSCCWKLCFSTARSHFQCLTFVFIKILIKYYRGAAWPRMIASP